jgi:serine/threonine-protein kinase
MLVSFDVGAVMDKRYRIEAEIGIGAQGGVYRASELRLGRAVALKILHPGSVGKGEAEARFLREAKLGRELQHPNTVRLLDFGRDDNGTPYLVYELLEGESLRTILRRDGPIDVKRVVRIAMQVLKSLQEAHSLGIVHRDIKPANIFLARYVGEEDFVKVLDFGIAKASAAQDTPLTAAGESLGTPSYMAPEQVKGEEVGPTVDLYALGLTLAEAVTGSIVVTGASAAAVAMEQAADRPVKLASFVLESPLGAIIQRATAKSRDARFPSASEMLAAVTAVFDRMLASPEGFEGETLIHRRDEMDADDAMTTKPRGVGGPWQAAQQPAVHTMTMPSSLDAGAPARVLVRTEFAPLAEQDVPGPFDGPTSPYEAATQVQLRQPPPRLSEPSGLDGFAQPQRPPARDRPVVLAERERNRAIAVGVLIAIVVAIAVAAMMRC